MTFKNTPPAISRRNLLARGAAFATIPLIATKAHSQMEPKPRPAKVTLFDRERFVEDCIRAHLETDPVSAVRDVLARAVSDPSSVLAGLGAPRQAIHSVTNPLLRFTGGIHIYGGDFFATDRHQWNPETLAQEPSDGETIRAMFARENERYNKTCL